MTQPITTPEPIFTHAEAARYIKRRQRRLWAIRMVLAILFLAAVILGPPVFNHTRTALWLTFLGANVDLNTGDDEWTTFVSFPITFRTNGAFTNADVRKLHGLHRLETLDLANAFDISALGLADLRRLPDLKVLDLNRIEDNSSQIVALPPKFSDDDLVHLEPLTRLRELTLAGNRITDAGLVHLAHLTDLESLDLEETNVTGTGLRHLRGLTKLKRLSLGKAKSAKDVIDPEAAMELNRALPDVVIHLKKEFEPE